MRLSFSVPAVTCLKFKDALNLAVGMSTGQVRLHSSSLPLIRFVEDITLRHPLE